MVKVLAPEFHTVRLCEGLLLEGMIKGNMVAPTVRNTPTQVTAPNHQPHKARPARSANIPKIKAAYAKIGNTHNTGYLAKFCNKAPASITTL